MIENDITDVTHDKIRGALERAVVLNEHLLRRAWGVLYAALSFSMSLSIFGLPIVYLLGVSKEFVMFDAITMNMVASGCGLIAILWAFRRVLHTTEVTNAGEDLGWARLLGYRFLVPIWIAIYAIMILTRVFASSTTTLTLFLIHLGIAFYLYYALELSFPKRLPPEALVAISTMMVTSGASIVLLLFTKTAGVFVLLWISTIVAWVFCGIYARTRPVPEFEEERTGLE